ncbi:MAG: hypothetical protein LUD17_09215 [Bacteroidales bacterium]|nr:hypothetical protein [Bacteroidales bacterium]
MRKIFTLTLVALMALAATAASPARDWGRRIVPLVQPQKKMMKAAATKEILVQEDFSKMTAGSVEAPDGLDLGANYYYGDPYLDETYFQTPGWSGSGIYQAGGCVALNEPGWGGVLNTPEINLQGHLELRFRAKNDNPYYDRVGFEVIVCSGGVFFPDIVTYSSVFIQRADGWSDYELEFDCPYAGADAFVQFNCYSEMVFIDDITLSRSLENIPCPTSASAFDFTTDGFTLSWENVPNADGYYVTLEEETVSGTSYEVDSWDIDDFSADGAIFPTGADTHGWTISLHGDTQVTADGGTDGSQALVMSHSDDVILYPCTGGMYQNATLTIIPITPLDQSRARIVIEGLYDGQWNTITEINYYQLNSNGPTVIDFAELEELGYGFVFSDYYTQIRVSGYNFSNEMYAIDDLSYVTTPATTARVVAQNVWVSDPTITFDGLDPDLEYYYTLRSTMGDAVSEISQRFHALGLPAPEVAEPVINSDGSFTARWEEVGKADRYYVGVYQIDNIEQDATQYAVLADDFSNIQSFYTIEAPYALPNASQEMSLDQYTVTPGWIGLGNIIADGMLGCATSEDDLNYIGTPYLTLSNGDASGVVRVKVWTESSDYFCIQCSEEVNYFYCRGGEWTEIEYAFTDGWQHDYLMLFCRNGNKFFIDDLEVIQNQVSAGDSLYWTLQEGGTSSTSMAFQIAPVAGVNYGYQVQAYQYFFRQTARSQWSETQALDFGLSGITSAENGLTIVNEQWYDLTGRKVANPKAGVYVRESTYSDGSIQTDKVAIY